MQKEIKVWDTNETVTILSAQNEGTHRVTWHRSDGGPDETFEVTPTQGDSVDDAIAKELRRRKKDERDDK